MVLNAKNVESERELVAKTAQEIGTQIVHYIPRDAHIQQAENSGCTVIEAFADSDMSKVYRELAEKVCQYKND